MLAYQRVFADNGINGIVAFLAQDCCRERQTFDWKCAMSSLKVILGLFAVGLALSGCMPATTYPAAPEATLKPHDKAQLAKAPYAALPPPEPFRRAIVHSHPNALPGTIIVHYDNHYL